MLISWNTTINPAVENQSGDLERALNLIGYTRTPSNRFSSENNEAKTQYDYIHPEYFFHLCRKLLFAANIALTRILLFMTGAAAQGVKSQMTGSTYCSIYY